MAKDNPSQLIRDLLYAYDHQLLEDPEGRALLQVINAGVTDAFIVGQLRGRVQKHQTAQLFTGPLRTPKLTSGRIVLGLDRRERPIRIPLQTLCAHSLTVAGSGAGKTVRSRFLALQVVAQTKGAWLFDFRKREFRCLVPWFHALGVEVIVAPARMMRLNPLQVPPQVDPHNWASRVADLLVQVFRLPPRATKLLQLTILDLFDRFGVLAGGAKYPTLFELRETIAHDAAANPQARAAVVDALDPVLVSLRAVLSYRRGWSSGDLAKHRIVFELNTVGEADKDLILTSLLMSEFTSRVSRGLSNRKMSLWLCCDEAARLVSASSSAVGISDMIGLARGTGIGLDLSIQSADIAPAILSNTANKFIGRCGSNADYETISAAMGLTAEQRRYLSHTLVPGTFVGQIGEGGWRHPFLVRVPYVDFTRPPQQAAQTQPIVGNLLPLLTESNLTGRTTAGTDNGLATLLALPTEAADEFRDWRPKGWSAATVAGVTATQPEPHLSDIERRYLRAVIDHPARPSSSYAKLAGVGTHQAIALRRRLVERGYLREHKVNAGRRGRASVVLEPLPTAYAALGLEGGT